MPVCKWAIGGQNFNVLKINIKELKFYDGNVSWKPKSI